MMMYQLTMLILLVILCDLTRLFAADQIDNNEHVRKTPTWLPDKVSHETFQDVLDPCGGNTTIITEPTIINFPSSNNLYDDDLDCVWRIVAPEDCIVEVQFYYVDIEDCTDCSCDSVSTYNGDLTTLIHKVCSPLLEESKRVYSYANHMDLKFSSDHTYRFQGFVANVNFVPKLTVALIAMKTLNIMAPAVAFFAAKTANIGATDEPELVDFDEIIINLYGGFNEDSNSFICPIAGDYCFSLSAGAMAGNPVGLILRINGKTFVSLVRESTEHNNVDTLSRSVIISLDQGDVIDLIVDRYTSAYSDQGFQTSLTGFMLPFNHGQYSNTGLFVGQGHNKTSSPLKLDKRLVGGSAWGSSTELFNVPYQGIYMCSMSAAIETRDTSGSVNLRHNASRTAAEIYRSSGAYIGFDTLSRDIIVEASSSEDTLSFTLEYQTTLGTPELQTSLSSYMISSPQYTRPLFSAYLTFSQSSGGIVTRFYIPVQVGTGFDGSTGIFTCQVPGVYFVTFSAGARGGYPVDLTLNVTSSMHPVRSHGGLTRLSTSHNGYDTLSRSLLIELEVGDEMFLDLASGGYLYSGYTLTSFSAFLLDTSPDFLKDDHDDAGSLGGILK